jgi:hypothetical protein
MVSLSGLPSAAAAASGGGNIHTKVACLIEADNHLRLRHPTHFRIPNPMSIFD